MHPFISLHFGKILSRKAFRKFTSMMMMVEMMATLMMEVEKMNDTCSNELFYMSLRH